MTMTLATAPVPPLLPEASETDRCGGSSTAFGTRVVGSPTHLARTEESTGGVRNRASLSRRSKEQYEASIAAVHPSDGGLPDGQIFHAAGASPGGWTMRRFTASKESWEQFRDGILMPPDAGWHRRWVCRAAGGDGHRRFNVLP